MAATSIPRSHPTSTPLVDPTNPTTNPVPTSVFNKLELPNTPPTRAANTTPTNAGNSDTTSEADRTPQASRHVSLKSTQGPSATTSSASAPAASAVTATPALSTSSTTSVPKHLALSSAADVHDHGQDSPVMNETLNVVQEHINNMTAPEHSTQGERRGTNDSGSEYSSHIDQRMSYINGEETDEEQTYGGADEVGSWTADQVATYLSNVGIEPKHCEVFRDQEITGDVLLNMDQASIMLKEFDLGPVGKRLKTWHKIKALQDEVNGTSPSGTRRSTQNYGSDIGSEESGRVRSQTLAGGTVLPRITSYERPESRQNLRNSQQKNTTNTTQSPTPMSPVSRSFVSPTTVQNRGTTLMNTPRRPSAASIRDLHHSRRHSSNDFSSTLFGTTTTSSTLTPGTDSHTTIMSGPSHKKGPSFDRGWKMGQSPSLSPRPASTGKHGLLDGNGDERSSGVDAGNTWDIDRGYFSGGELEGRQRNVLRKRVSQHSRNSSYTDEQRVRSATTNARHSRFGSVDSFREPHMSPASQKYYGLRGSRRTNSSNSIAPAPPPKDTISPTVTKLDGKTLTTSPIDFSRSADKLSTPDWLQAGNGITSPRVQGLRSTSDAVTGPEKSRLGASADSLIKDGALQSPSHTGSTSSQGPPSLELDSANGAKTPNSMTPKTSRSKSKKQTSAYTRGLEKKTPREQMEGCDYSGWMKKKNTNLMTTWKSRLFVLRGRRLSYYYSENDTEEQGLIDISFHRVLPADTDRITGLHATITGATTSPTAPVDSHTETLAEKDEAADPMSTLNTGLGDQTFIFKLVPPRPGLSRAVSFTKPTVHYFAVPNLTQGRLWMAALMKATIDRDESKPITTTYTQKTISLAKARAMKHRPPALMNLDEKGEEVEPAMKSPLGDLGLNISGINFDKDPGVNDSGVSDVSKSEGPTPKIGGA